MRATGEQHQGVRTVLADRQSTVRDALRILVTQGLGMQVVDEAGTLQTLQREVRAHHPDLLIVDWDLLAQPKSVLADLRACSPGLRIVVVGLPGDASRRAGGRRRRVRQQGGSPRRRRRRPEALCPSYW